MYLLNMYCVFIIKNFSFFYKKMKKILVFIYYRVLMKMKFINIYEMFRIMFDI